MLIPIAAVIIGAGRRKTSKDVVDWLASSIETIGLQTPITVLALDADGKYALVAGLHRLKACSQLGHTAIEATIIEDKIEAALWEISENLHRAELTAMQRNLGIGRWVKLTTDKFKREQRVKGAQVAPPSGGAQPHDKGIRAASREFGVSRRKAQRAVNIATGLTKKAQKVAEELGLDNNQRALERAAGAPDAENQVHILNKIVAEQDRKKKQKAQIAENFARAAAPRTGPDIFDQWLASLDIERRAVVRIWLLGADLEAHFAELDRADELIRSDQQAMH